jgi:hypothetical protein
MAAYLVPYLTLYPVLIGFVALAIGAVRRDRMWRKKKVAQLVEDTAKALAIPEGYEEVQSAPLARRDGLTFEGTLMLVAAGTPSLNRLLDTLVLLDRAGLADMVGSILVYECETTSRVKFGNSLPVVYHDRIVYAAARDFPNGFGNQPPETVEGKIGRWGVELKDAIAAVIKLHEERNGRKPGQVILYVSLGGHAYPGIYIAQELHAALDEAQIVGVVNLPRKTSQRRYFLTLKARYEGAGVAAWLVSDQLQPDWVTQDSVVGAIFATLASAALGSDGAPATNNIITNVAGVGKKGGMVRFVYYYSDVVAHPYPTDINGNLRYYVPQEQVVSELRKVIGEVERGEGAVSIGVPVKQHETHIYDIAVVQLESRITRDIRDEIERSRDLEDAQLAHLERPHRHPTVDYETIYTSWSLPIDPAHPRCRLLVVRLQAIDASLEEVVATPPERSSTAGANGASDGAAPAAPKLEPVAATSAVVNGTMQAEDLGF